MEPSEWIFRIKKTTVKNNNLSHSEFITEGRHFATITRLLLAPLSKSINTQSTNHLLLAFISYIKIYTYTDFKFSILLIHNRFL